MLQLQTPEPLV